MEAHVIAGRLAPFNVRSADKMNAARRPNEKALRRGGAGSFPQGRRERQQLPPELARLIALKLITSVRQRRRKSHAAEGLQQVIERVNLERAHRVFVVRRDEDHGWYVAGLESPHHLEPVHFRHLDIEKDEVWR